MAHADCTAQRKIGWATTVLDLQVDISAQIPTYACLISPPTASTQGIRLENPMTAVTRTKLKPWLVSSVFHESVRFNRPMCHGQCLSRAMLFWKLGERVSRLTDHGECKSSPRTPKTAIRIGSKGRRLKRRANHISGACAGQVPNKATGRKVLLRDRLPTGAQHLA